MHCFIAYYTLACLFILPFDAVKNCNAVICDRTISRGINKVSKQEQEWHRVYKSTLSDLSKEVGATLNINRFKNPLGKAGKDARKT